MDLQSSVLDELERRRRKAALLQSKMWAATSAELATSAAGSSAAADMDDLWGGGDSSDDDGFGDDGCDDSLGMAEHDAAGMKSRMANVGFQSTVGFQYEERKYVAVVSPLSTSEWLDVMRMCIEHELRRCVDEASG